VGVAHLIIALSRQLNHAYVPSGILTDAVCPMTFAELEELVTHSSQSDGLRGISGMLLYSGGH